MGVKKIIFLMVVIVSLIGYKQSAIAQIDPLWWEEVQQNSLNALRKGDYQNSLKIAENALTYCRARKDAAQYYYEGLHFMGSLYEAMGNYSMGIKYINKAIVFSNSLEGRRYANLEKDRLFISKLYMQALDWENAALQLDSLKIILGPQLKDNPVLAAEVSTLLGETYIQQGFYAKAVASFEAAAAVILKQYGARHLVYADALNRTVYAYMQTQNYEKALYGSEKALKIYQLQGRKQGICAFTLNNMAVSAQRIGRMQIAENYYKEALSIYTLIYGESHPNCVSIRNNLGILYEQLGEEEKAGKLLSQTVEELLVQIDQFYNTVSEVERLHFYRTKIANNIDAFYSFVSRQQHDSLLLQMQEISLRIKNAATYSSANLKSIVLSEQQPELQKIYEDWFQLRQMISQIYAWPKERIKSQRINIRQLEIEAIELERKMAEKSSTISMQFDKKVLNSAKLQEALKEGEASVDFIHFHYRKVEGWTDSIMYYALINRGGGSLPSLVPLATARDLRFVLGREVGLDPWSGRLLNSYISNEHLNEELYRMVWAPLEPHLEGIKRIHIAPSGWLCQLAFAALKAPSGEYLADLYDLRYYAAMRDFIYPSEIDEKNPSTALLYGGIDFDAKLDISIAEEGGTALDQGQSSQELLSDMDAEAWGGLPASKTEVELIAEMLDAKGEDYELVVGADAREDSFKIYLMEQSPRIIHLATHAYFIAGASYMASVSEIQGLSNKLQYEPHPLWRSGLILAGANAAWTGEGGVSGLKDGILPAYDIAAMNLYDTELVVLSACQTGRGDVDNIEGVQGLQSAFRQAGVRYQLLSLWNISDAAAAKMMELFYKHYLNAASIPKAFRAAIKELRSIERFSSPFYWGAFILIE